jgi:hypothetical protein
VGANGQKRRVTDRFARTLSLTFRSFNFSVFALAALVPPVFSQEPSDLHFGPLFDRFPLTLNPGTRSEALGPLLGLEKSGSSTLFRLSPVFSLYQDGAVDQTEAELLYPIISFDQFGPEYRFQLFQLISWSGGESMKGSGTKRTTLFPFYISQRSPRPEDNYTAVIPFYGRLKNRFFRDEIFFVMLPLYLETTKRGVLTRNFLFPFFHVREGAGVTGWQFWPLYGTEHKKVTTSTNNWGEPVVSPGYDKKFVFWPFYFNNTLGSGTNTQKQFVLLPFYTSQVSSSRVSKSYGFPIGVTHTVDRAAKYEEWDAPWPLVVFANGEGKRTRRVWPLFSQAETPTARSEFYAWPIYKFNRLKAESVQRERTRILLFLYSDIREKNATNNTIFHRRDFWPLFTWRKDHQNNTRLQFLSILEPILPGNKSIERLYSPAYALYREERNATTGDTSKSFLWNLYRSEKQGEVRRQRALFGLFQREKTDERTKWKIFYIPFTTTPRTP